MCCWTQKKTTNNNNHQKPYMYIYNYDISEIILSSQSNENQFFHPLRQIRSRKVATSNIEGDQRSDLIMTSLLST